MLTITLKTLQQQTFKIEIDPELTVSNTLEFPCPSKWATARARGTGKYRGLVVSNLNMKGDTILNHVAIHAIWEWHSVFVEVLWFYRCFLATPVFCPEMTAQYLLRSGLKSRWSSLSPHSWSYRLKSDRYICSGRGCVLNILWVCP